MTRAHPTHGLVGSDSPWSYLTYSVVTPWRVEPRPPSPSRNQCNPTCETRNHQTFRFEISRGHVKIPIPTVGSNATIVNTELKNLETHLHNLRSHLQCQNARLTCLLDKVSTRFHYIKILQFCHQINILLPTKFLKTGRNMKACCIVRF